MRWPRRPMALEAIEYLDEHQRPTVILIDMRMPRCDGATTVRRSARTPQ